MEPMKTPHHRSAAATTAGGNTPTTADGNTLTTAAGNTPTTAEGNAPAPAHGNAPQTAPEPHAPASAGGHDGTRPNIVFILTDDHAAHAISAYSGRVNSTPNLDRIAAQGARLDSLYCTNSICTPSRATILSGTYSHINGA